ncbi:MAG: DUF3524 domain-containing protein [Desulfobacteraceae bacterium]|nr:DUF3524 domain-containing protein [Desulfobacteraceae bacterium]
MKICFLEPFFGGSHEDFATGLSASSRHDIRLFTMPARFWKWRSRGAALHFIHKLGRVDRFDGIMASDLLNLADFKALVRGTCPPIMVYFHENQLSYPLASGERMDYQFGFTNITTALTADRILFNSATHLNSFLDRLPGFLSMMPDYRPNWVVDAIDRKVRVLHPGCRFSSKDEVRIDDDDQPPLIIWNHRWEFDKQPARFFQVLDMLVEKGIDFRLALLGEKYQKIPGEFELARKRFHPYIVQYGYVDAKADYFNWLKKGDIVISTAQQENFGISVVEAVRHGCMPFLPNRLSYPEIIPAEHHGQVLYDSRDSLLEKVIAFFSNPSRYNTLRRLLSRDMGKYAWEKMAPLYDREWQELIGGDQVKRTNA